ncbi:MAG: DNA polymerase III subunit delta [Clostridia bacterium]|nr:DNA polymerase III subunit delta [Clostridia bacterium]
MPQKEDNFLILKKQLKSGKTGNLYLFFGEETFIKDSYVKYMQNLVPDDGFSDFNKVFIDGKDAEFDRIDDAIDSFPVMAERKVIVIKDSGIFKSKIAGGEEVRNFWQKRLYNLPDFVILIFDEQDIDKRSSLYKLVLKQGLPVEFSYLKDYELIAWIVREAQKNGKKISKSTAEYLLSLCDPGISNVKNELLKLFNYCGDEIYQSDVEKVVSKPLSVVIFDITDAILKGDRDSAVKTLLKLQENKVSAFNVMYLLSSNFDKLLRCKLLLKENATYDAIASRLKISPYVAKKYIADCKGFSEDFLIERIRRTAEYDFKIKQGLVDEGTALITYVTEALK